MGTGLSETPPAQGPPQSAAKEKVSYTATVLDKAEAEKIKIDGEIRNVTNQGSELKRLLDMVEKKIISVDQFAMMHETIMKANGAYVADVTAAVASGIKGKEFVSKGIYNSTTGEQDN
ncbi:hypothetical protein BDQ17DRAFT_1547144 [Cyathus striatus]|nr:hypothetical protein BDQ17DRAFT_1547144 [Cyathus striatus]